MRGKTACDLIPTYSNGRDANLNWEDIFLSWRTAKAQVSRMLRFSEVEKKVVREFKILHVVDHPNRSFSGRVFHSLTLFEDMVKCILLCNRQ
ncbi:hypothetical protein JHK85_012236 [Glycine max]|nr:hypothetical protein JHK87_011799 [Glycine soja]KAG5039760.1 hypothetical protein JHK85_012236 [Glycine max]